MQDDPALQRYLDQHDEGPQWEESDFWVACQECGILIIRKKENLLKEYYFCNECRDVMEHEIEEEIKNDIFWDNYFGHDDWR